MANTCLSVAIHIMALIALNPRETLSSEMIANNVTTNPVVIRQISSSLKEAGLLIYKLGVPVFSLTKEPNKIYLFDIQNAFQVEKEFSLH